MHFVDIGLTDSAFFVSQMNEIYDSTLKLGSLCSEVQKKKQQKSLKKTIAETFDWGETILNIGSSLIC